MANVYAIPQILSGHGRIDPLSSRWQLTETERRPMLKSLRTTRGRLVIAVVASVALVASWATWDMPIALVPALMIPFWIPIFDRREVPVTPRARRFMLASVVVGILMLLVLLGIYVAQR
jgi:hypothetical protein